MRFSKGKKMNKRLYAEKVKIDMILILQRNFLPFWAISETISSSDLQCSAHIRTCF